MTGVERSVDVNLVKKTGVEQVLCIESLEMTSGFV